MDRSPAESGENIMPRKTYTEPKLTEYGSVAKITQALAKSVVSDSGSNSMHP